jgi:hypothetical protein
MGDLLHGTGARTPEQYNAATGLVLIERASALANIRELAYS